MNKMSPGMKIFLTCCGFLLLFFLSVAYDMNEHNCVKTQDGKSATYLFVKGC